ncbi:MAG: NAD(P)/FAD-dependent oxidoreductase, partial [Gemmatimonadota bacterium]
GLAAWLWTFARHCGTAHVEHCRRVMQPFARTSPALHDEIAAEAPADLGYRTDGYLEIFRTSGGRTTAEHEAAYAGRLGFTPHALDADQVRDREPSLTTTVLGGFQHDEGRTMDPFKFVEHVANLARRHGARFRTGVEIEQVATAGGRAVGVRTKAGEEIVAAAVVLATGAYSPHLYRRLGCPLPVQPAKGYHLDLGGGSDGAPAVSHPCLFVERAVFCTPLPGRLRLAGTLEFSGLNHDLRRPRLEQLTASAADYVDGVVGAPVTSEWCGLRPCTPDGLPAVGPLPGWEGIFAATGHAMLGLTFGPTTGEALADLVLTGESGLPLTGFEPARFR